MFFQDNSNAIGCREAQMALEENNAIVIDIRDSMTYKSGHIEGAVNFPVETLERELQNKSLDKYKDRQMILVCYTGTTVVMVAQLLKSLGFDKVYRLEGGMMIWQMEGNPVVK